MPALAGAGRLGLLSLLNDGKFEKWERNNPKPTNSLQRLLTTSSYGAVDASQDVQPTFYGDILGDWREEAVHTNVSHNQLIIFTTNHPTSTRLSPSPTTPPAATP